MFLLIKIFRLCVLFSLSSVFFIFCAFVSISETSCNANKKEIAPVTSSYDTIKSYTNPVGDITDIGDPYVLKYNNKYYLYATSSGIGFKVWQSDNMVEWKEICLALNRNDIANQWGSGNFWAPEVKYLNNKFYMTYSAIGDNGKMKIRIATSDNPIGPFTNWSPPFFNDDSFSYIDGDLLIDGDKVYLYYVKDCSENVINGKHISQIHVVELSSDLKNTVGSPTLILTPSQSREGLGGDWQWNEGPFAMKHDGIYYLMYSANVYSSIDYSIGYATATSPMGTWTKYENNPVLKKDINLKVSGPGHNCVTTSLDDKEFFIVYHTHTYFDAPSGNRNVCIDRLYFENGIMKVKGPTRTPQTLPSGVSPIIVKKGK